MKPEISVIVPMYNVEKYIRECVDSILAQENAPSFEIILVDDGSTDQTAAVCREAYGGHPQVRLETYRPAGNRGVSAARNLGIAMAEGNYILFVDSDDAVLPGCLAKLWQTAEKYAADITAASYVSVGKVRHIKYLIDKPGVLTKDKAARLKLLIARRVVAVIWGKLYRRSFLLRTEMRFEKIYAEDLLFHFLAAWQADTYILLPDVLYRYREREGSLSKAQTPAKMKDIVDTAIRLQHMLQEQLPKLLPDNEADRQSIRENFLNMYVSNMIVNWGEGQMSSQERAQAIQDACRPYFGRNTEWAAYNLQLMGVLALENKQLTKENQQLREKLAARD